MKKRLPLALFILSGIFIIAVLVFLAVYRPARAANAHYTNLGSIRAMRVDYLDEDASRGQVPALEKQMQQVGINLVALGAGRVDWTYFLWPGHQDQWSGDVRSSGRDFLLEDSSRFGKWAHVSAVVDVLAPLYIQANPQAAAVSWAGTPSKYLVGTMELVDGQFGQELLQMIEDIATYYPVNSITLTELVYYTDGFGETDKAAYMDYTGRSDWPHNANGTIDIDEPSIGTWRVYEIDRFLEKATAIAHQHGKQLFLETHLRVDPGGWVVLENGTDPDQFLKYADRLVMRCSNDPDERTQTALAAISQYLSRYPENRIVPGLGLWARDYDSDTPREQMSALPLADFQSALQWSGRDLWITPSFLMNAADWQVLKDFWNGQSTP